jgi:hypothetical protein
MTEALFRIPSRTVTYGYVEVSVDLGHSDPEIIAATYVSWVHAFQKEELATIERLKDAPSGALKAPLAASQPEVDHPVDPVDKAAQMVAEGLGGATEIPEYEVGDAVTVGGIEFTKHSEAPWEQDLARKSKPWEAEATASIAAARTVTLAENLDTPDW